MTLPDGSRLRYDKLVADSRCPPKVQCIWAGDAELAFTWTAAGTAPRGFSLHTGTDPRRETLGRQQLSLQTLASGDQPVAGLLLEAAGK